MPKSNRKRKGRVSLAKTGEPPPCLAHYEDGTGSGYEADSPHPLQLQHSAFDEATLCFTNVSAEIALQFSDEYPPHSITAQRWPSEYAYGSQDIQEHLNSSEHVAVSGSSIHLDDDGHNYIYEISATWQGGSSRYTFRVFTGRQSLGAENETVIPGSELLRTGEYYTIGQIETLMSEALSWKRKSFGMGGFAVICVIDPADGSDQQVYLSIDRGRTPDSPYGSIYERMQIQPLEGAAARVFNATLGGGSGELLVVFRVETEDAEWLELFYIFAGDLSENTENWVADGKWQNQTESSADYLQLLLETPLDEILLYWEVS